MQAARYVLDQRGNNTTGWALVHRMNARARLKDAGQAHEAYAVLIKERTMPNLWATHPPFQIDANLGLVAGVAEMLLQSHEDFIEILPALPEAWKTGKFNGLVARGNFEVSAGWDNSKLTSLRITSNAGEVCNFKYAGLRISRIIDGTGKSIKFSYNKQNVATFKTILNGSYTVLFSK
jgi:alpha-L-fucosidase 2